MLKRKRRLKLKKFFISFLLFVLVISSTGPVLLYPRPAHAQQIVTDLVGIATDVGQWIADQATWVWDNLLKEAAAVGFKNVVGSFLNQIAFDAAMAVANGGKGQGPLFIGDPNYWANLADSVTGDLLNEFAKGAWGIDLCTFGWDPKLQLSMMFAIEDPCAQFDTSDNVSGEIKKQPPAQCKAKCSISAMVKNAQKFKKFSLKDRFEFKAGLGTQASSARDNAEAIGQSISNDTALYGGTIRDDLLIAHAAIVNISQEFYSTLVTDIWGWLELDSGIPDVDAARKAGAEAAAAARLENYTTAKDDFVGKITLLISLVDIVETQLKSNKELCRVTPDGTDPDDPEWLCNRLYYGGGYTLGSITPKEWIQKAKRQADSYIDQLVTLAESTKADLNDMMNKLKNDELKTVSDYVSLKDAAKQLTCKGNDYCVFLEAQSKTAMQAAKKKEKTEFMQMLQGRLNDITSTISGYTKTPSTFINDHIASAINSTGQKELTYTGSIAADTIGVFVNTLTTQLMQKAMQGLLSALSPQTVKRDYSDLYNTAYTPLAYGGVSGWGLDGGGCNRDIDCQPGYTCTKLGTPAGYCEKQTSCRQPGESCFIPSEANPASQGQQSRECCERLQCTKGQCVEIPTEEGGNVSAPDVLSDISGGVEESKKYLSTNLDLKQVEPTSYDLLTQFSLCSSSTQINRLSDNCVIDQGFVQAIRQQQSYGFMSIDDAISKDFLHKNWKIGN
jgi:hypothetical protein